MVFLWISAFPYGLTVFPWFSVGPHPRSCLTQHRRLVAHSGADKGVFQVFGRDLGTKAGATESG